MIGNSRLLVQLRTVAILLQVAVLTIALVLRLPVNTSLFMGGISIQIVVNVLAYAWISRGKALTEFQLFFQLILDLASLNIFALAGGGLANPFSGLFLIQAVLASLFLTGIRLWALIVATGVSYSWLLLGLNASCETHHLWMGFHLQGMVLNHILTTVVVGYFLTRIMSNFRLQEQQLSARHSLVGAGATAAQMAHKLSSPLNTMGLIAEDLPDNHPHKQTFLNQIRRSKEYLSTLFKKLHRLDSEEKSVLLTPYLTTFLTQARQTYPGLTIHAQVQQDRLLRTMSAELLVLILDIFLENALEAKAKTAAITVIFTEKSCKMHIKNDGPPFPEEIKTLMKAGYSSHKEQFHTGMGLFLARLIIENLDGKIELKSDLGVDMVIVFPIGVLCQL